MKPGRPIALAAVALLAMAAAPAPRKSHAAPARAAAVNWNDVVSQTAQGGHLVGNPNAAVKLIEYVSYTCPHCAHFEAEADAPLRQTFIATGRGSVEYRPLIRNKIDIAVSLLAACGPVTRFRANHSAFLRGQEQWFQAPPAGAEERWASSDFAAAMRAIATDLKLYAVLEGRGYTRPELDRCLTNRAAADKLAAQTQYAVDKLGVQGTPSFIVNGQLQDAHSWDELRPKLAPPSR